MNCENSAFRTFFHSDIADRLDAVSEAKDSNCAILRKTRDLLLELPDVERALMSAVHGKVGFSHWEMDEKRKSWILHCFLMKTVLPLTFRFLRLTSVS